MIMQASNTLRAEEPSGDRAITAFVSKKNEESAAAGL